METFETGPVRLRWEAEARIVRMDFPRARSTPGESDAAACIERMRAWTAGGPFALLVDCQHLASVDAGWRARFAEFFKGRKEGLKVAWFNLNTLVGIIVQMFVRATKVRGRAFPDEASARAWIAQREAEA